MKFLIEFKKYFNLHTLFGVGIGVILMLTIILLTNSCFKQNIDSNPIAFNPIINLTSIDTNGIMNICDSVECFISSNVKTIEKKYGNITDFQHIYDEKINSLNTRINDLYVSGGIIVTLLLLFGVVSNIRARNETKIFLEENFNSIKNEMEEELKSAKIVAGKIQAQYNLLPKNKNNTEQE